MQGISLVDSLEGERAIGVDLTGAILDEAGESVAKATTTETKKYVALAPGLQPPLISKTSRLATRRCDIWLRVFHARAQVEDAMAWLYLALPCS